MKNPLSLLGGGFSLSQPSSEGGGESPLIIESPEIAHSDHRLPLTVSPLPPLLGGAAIRRPASR
jgi:hypothetical protein